ncbi:MAG: TetR/AcrR family transcriptional regulator [Myxococcales bacterium]|nr:TetR/AcrR family transcriptional regulator [Myxococcales bacterium]
MIATINSRPRAPKKAPEPLSEPTVKPLAARRAEQKHEAMRAVQDAALSLIEASGYDAVRIEDIAREAGVGPASVYRYFSTKERVVLWDEYDAAMFAQFEQALSKQGPVEAMRATLGASLDAVYRRDKERILRRARLIAAVPALAAGAAADAAGMRVALAAALVRTKRARTPFEAQVIAAALTGVIVAAVEAWVETAARKPLLSHIERALDTLAKLATDATGREVGPRIRDKPKPSRE